MSKRILVVEDQADNRRILQDLLTRAGYEIILAENGQEAIELAIKHRPDLIILDMSMPVLNGMQAARELKKILPDVPIILFTQHEHMSRVIVNSDRTVDRVVSKSDADALMGSVRSLAPA